MSHQRRVLALAAAALAAVIVSACSGPGSTANSAKPRAGGTVTFAEQPGSPPTYIFPLYNGANSGNNNITYLQPLMWLPLYWFGHPDNDQATINYQLSMADPPVFSDGGKTVTMTLKNYKWSNGKPVTSRDLVFWMNLLLAEKNHSAAYVPGGWMDHVAGMSAPFAAHVRAQVERQPTTSTYLLYNGLSMLSRSRRRSWDKTSATGRGGQSTTRRQAGAKAVYNFLNKESMSLSTWDTNPLWQVVDGPWHLEPKTGFQVTGQTILRAEQVVLRPGQAEDQRVRGAPVHQRDGRVQRPPVGQRRLRLRPRHRGRRAAGPSSHRATPSSPGMSGGSRSSESTSATRSTPPLENQLYIRQAMQPSSTSPPISRRSCCGYGTPTYGPVPTFPADQFPRPGGEDQPVPVQPSAAQKLLTDHGWTIPASGTRPPAPGQGRASSECGAGIAAGTKLAIPLLYSSGIPGLDDEVQAMQSAFGQRASSCTAPGALSTPCWPRPTHASARPPQVPGQLDRAEPPRVADLHLRANLLPRLATACSAAAARRTAGTTATNR